MAEFFSFLKVFVLCGTVFFIATAVLLAMPQSKLRSVGLEMSKWAMVGGFFILVGSPLDFLPDPIYLDDIGYVVGAIAAAKSALSERKKRAVLEELEFDQLVSQKRDAMQEAASQEQKEAA